ncbi:MAG: aminodeoxychorismate synthase component I, partial [Chitinivibrionales bacterium]|nr:aminodeoxychorismate synthase component I [Chitinivibrionales bacterium]MBD3355620.1 aminodeoxychorismate synthase component I [Chitinivibrionales bacterium]
PSTEHTVSYLFYEPAYVVVAQRLEEVPGALEDVERLSKTHWVAGFVAYEAAYALEERLAKFCTTTPTGELPPVWFGAFSRPYVFDHRTGCWDRPIPSPVRTAPPNCLPTIRNTIEHKRYTETIAAIKHWIAEGHTYQANFTFDMELCYDGEPFGLYRMIRENQRTPYCSFIHTAYGHIASFSPELFFRQRGELITVKPMKGTARRGYFAEEDAKIREWLVADEKNRAENVMIVDLLRNDLGRVCRPGTVHVRKLFEVEMHPTVHQMTSTIQGRLRRGTGLRELFRALFPCGSVTGAPKIRTMEIIRELEQGPRGIYCGAVGYVAPTRKAEFSVPIRTLLKGAGSRHWRYRVGSGIVWESNPAAEWEECKIKCAFLTQQKPRFELLESILYRNGPWYLKEHRDRLFFSARYFGYPLKRRELERLIADIRRSIPPGSSHKVRILLSADGNLRWESSPLKSGAFPSIMVELSPNPINEKELLLYHKTTHRPWYAESFERASKGECYDVIHTNSGGEITEGARSNVFARIDGRLVTPPVSCGLLAGVLRRRLIESGKCDEEVLTFDDLCRAEELYCGNSVRGLVRVSLRSPEHQPHGDCS